MGLNAEVVAYNRIREFLGMAASSKDKMVIIFGPGPGHPSEYLFLQDFVLSLLLKPNIFIVGICLGHQLLWYFLGQTISHCHNPVHGQVEKYKLSSEKQKLFGLPEVISVQRYNSLGVKAPANGKKYPPTHVGSYEYEGEIIISKFKNALSYQFHPESVGTSFPSLFFRPIKEFLAIMSK